MQVLAFRRDGRVQALLSLFGVHATCVGNTNTRYSGDNKGYAALAAEAQLAANGASDPVALMSRRTIRVPATSPAAPPSGARRNMPTPSATAVIRVRRRWKFSRLAANWRSMAASTRC